MRKVVVCSLLVKCLFCFVYAENGYVASEARLTMKEIVEKYGYPFEVFPDVRTADGYLLDIYRIPHGKNKTNVRRPAVLLVHGLTGSSRNFVVMGPERGLAFLLADRNYDVWLLNSRGTPASRKHLTLNPTQSAYWKFSWHEIGVYDIPATMELIRNVTKLERVSYIGHSQGTSTFFILAAEKPEYNKNITISLMLGPEAYIKLDSPVFKFLAQFETLGRTIVEMTGINQYPPPPINIPYSAIVNIICSLEGFFQDICSSFFFIQGGYNPDQTIKGDYAKLAAGYPIVASRQFLHYAQNSNSGIFRQYDFGPEKNLEEYGSVEPPAYNLSLITAPVGLYYSEEDWLVDPKDVDKLCEELGNCVHKYLIADRKFTHYDFLVAKDIVKLVYDDIFKTLKIFNKKCKKRKAC